MIVIIGASGGIGKYLAERYSDAGEKVIGTFLNTPLSDVSSPKYKMVRLDSKYINEVISFTDEYMKGESEITLINCLGINYNIYCHKSASDEWRNVIETNLIGVYNAIRASLPFMRANSYGRIINFSSVVPQIGVAGTTAYSASKSGLWGLAKSLAAENAMKNITVNNINLGYFDIGMINDIPVDVLHSIKERIPAKRLGNDYEIFHVVEMLRRVGYINGASIDINGGL